MHRGAKRCSGATRLLDGDRARRAGEAQAQAPMAVKPASEGGPEPIAAEPAPNVDSSAPDAQAVREATEAIERAAARTEPAPGQGPGLGHDSDERGDAPPAAPPAEPAYARPASFASAPSAAVQATGAGRQHRFQPSQPTDAVPADAVSADRFHDPSYDEVLRAMVEWVVQREGPVLDAVLARRIARAHGFQRTGSRIQERVEQVARQLFATTEESVGTFYWPRDLAAGAEATYRWPADEDSARGVEEICEQELLMLARSVIASGKTAEDALLAMAREMGLARLRTASRSRLEVALAAAMSRP